MDNMALHLLFSIKNLVSKEMQARIIDEMKGYQGIGLERMLEESPSITEKWNKLKKSIKLLKELVLKTDKFSGDLWSSD